MTKKTTKADLQRKIMELESQLAHRYHYAQSEIKKASTDHLMASGAIVSVAALGGRVIMGPVLIHDGLSPETIAAIQNDLHRSYEQATMRKTKPAA